MSAVALAVVGKDNEPLFIQEFESPERIPFSDAELFGIATMTTTTTTDTPISLRQQFILHQALDRFEALSGPHPGCAWREPKSTGHDAMFVGLLCPVDEMRVYGYMTTTQIKFLLTIRDEPKLNDATVKRLFIKLHRCYVEYMLNPFSPLSGPIESPKFEQKVKDCVKAYNRAISN